MLKQIIKDLSTKQTSLKKARKTGSNPDAKAIAKSNSVATMAWLNAIKITAALNLMHETRGSVYRHNVPDGAYQWWYKKEYDSLKNTLSSI